MYILRGILLGQKLKKQYKMGDIITMNQIIRDAYTEYEYLYKELDIDIDPLVLYETDTDFRRYVYDNFNIKK